MARYFLLTLVFALTGTITFAQTTSLAGKISDSETGEELIGANVILYKGGVLSTGASTDFEGNYSIKIDPGTYDVEVSYIGYSPTRITDVIIGAGEANKLDVQLGTGGAGGVSLDEIVVTEYKVPLIRQDNTTQGGTITSEEISKLPSKNIGALAASTAGLSQLDEGDAISVRGSRSNGTDVYVDGIRVNANAVQSTDIEQLQVITGGIPANYGDVTGGVISITTKGPSSTFSGGVEVESSEFLDDYGYNDFRAYISGPILKKKSGESIIGFRLSGSYISRKDDDPPATDVFVINDDKLAELEANPVDRIGTSKVVAGERLTNEDVSSQGYRPNEESAILNITGKIDARLSKNVDITLTGAYVDQQNKFTPATSWRLMNSHNNPTTFTDRIRGNFRFRHRLGGGVNLEDGEEEAKKSSFIQNAQYILQLGYEKGRGTTYDPRHEDRLFDYGHVGNFDYQYSPTIDFRFNGVDFEAEHVDFSETFVGYDPSTARNPVLANYNNVADLSNDNDFAVRNGLYITETNIWNDFHTSPGVVYNLFNENETDLYTGNASISFDLLPGGSDKGRHSVQIGFTYEQRFERNYSVSPFELWEVARQSANDRHILGVNTQDSIGVLDIGNGQQVTLFNSLLDDRPDLRFYRKVRELDNISLHDFVNIQGIDPDQLSLDMFAPSELSAYEDLISYYGYNHLGEKLDNSVKFDDFFSAKDEDGIRSFVVPSNQPNYLAVYLQDKFTFKDIILRFGVRLDRFDANTKIMKDPYSLYEIQSANEFFTNGEELPGAVQGDYKVYLEGTNSNVVRAYRNGDDWFDVNGTQVNSGTLIFGSDPVFPALKNEDANIQDDGYDTSNSFEDYKPQINVMPRLAFSFPISDAANFFAHYDILVQRPQSNNLVTPLDYYYFYERTPENNGALRPERTVDYEVGFQQKLSNSSALKIAAYYKEMRDMIQLRTYLHVPVIGSYTSFGNLDFGTVKGFSLQYDLRRTGNIQASVNYTLQFAEGTGSDAESQRGLTSRGNLRYLYPLNFDERHRIVTSIDYRYASGKKYNGPRWFGKDVFAKTGLNLQAIAVSGRPYTVKEVPTRLDGAGTVGAINGARKPWNFTINARVDKTFDLTKSKDGKRGMSLNVFFRVQNVLDFRNIVNVYSSTGSPDDDGYLSSSFGEDDLSQIIDSKQQAFLDAYSWRVLNPNNYTLPRRMFVGATFFF